MQQGTRNVSGVFADDRDTFTTDRRWILGRRTPPLYVEKIKKKVDHPPDKKLTLFARSGAYSIMVFGDSDLRWTFQGNQDTKTFDLVMKGKVDAIFPSPYEGFFLLAIRPGHLSLLNTYVKLIDFPQTAKLSLSLTSFHWIKREQNMLFLFAGSIFGHVLCFNVQPTGATEKTLYIDDAKAPISSIASIIVGNVPHIIVATFRNLLIFEWPSSAADLILKTKIDRPSGPSMCIPSFVSANDEYVVWLNHDELHFYNHQQVLGEGIGIGCSLPFEDLRRYISSEPHVFLAQDVSPIMLTKYYCILAADSAITCFSLSDPMAEPSRFPLANTSPPLRMSIDQHPRPAIIITSKDNEFRIDMANEQPVKKVKTIREYKEERLVTLNPCKEVTANEMLTTLLEKGDFQLAICILGNMLDDSIKRQKKKNDDGKTLNPLTINHLCIEFLIFELQLIQACNLDNPTIFAPPMKVHCDDFDLFVTIEKLLQLRAFSPVSKKIDDEKLLEQCLDSPEAVRILFETERALQDGKLLDKIIEKGIDPKSVLSVLIRKHTTDGSSKLNQIFEKSKIPNVADVLIKAVPLIGVRLPSECVFDLLEYAVSHEMNNVVESLIIALTLSDRATEYDEKLSQFIKNRRFLNVLYNGFSILEHCFANKMYRTAAQVASFIGLFKESVRAAMNVGVLETRHFIRIAKPNSLRTELYRMAKIEPEEKDDVGLLRSKQAVAKELSSTMDKLKHLELAAEESASFLNVLGKWGGAPNEPDPNCAFCGKPMRGCQGFAFNCGHSFHQNCLVRSLSRVLDMDEYSKLQIWRDTDAKKYEEVLLNDCPSCGMKSMTALRKPLADENDITQWDLKLDY